MSKKAPSLLSGGAKPSKRRWEKLSVRFTSAEFCIGTVVALQHRPRTWQSEGCPLTDIQRLTVIAGLRFSEEAVHGNIYKLLTQT
jgi:hypothetical protein